MSARLLARLLGLALAPVDDGRDYVCGCGRLRPPGTACVCGA